MKPLWRSVVFVFPILILMMVGSGRAVVSPDMVEAPKWVAVGSADTFVEMHGLVNVEAFNFQSGNEHAIPSFDLHNWFFIARAQLANDLSIVSELEYEHGSADIKIDRAYLEVSSYQWATVRIGRFYSPMSYERVHYWAPVRLMTSRPFMVDVAFHEWSDTGMELMGEIPLTNRRFPSIEYEVAVMNGVRSLTEAGNPVSLGVDDRDNNRNKAVVARINIDPIEGLTVGSAYGTGKYDDADTLGYHIVEVDARFTKDRLDIWGEYMKRTGDDEPAPVSTNPFITGAPAGLEGYYLVAGYSVIQDQPHVVYLKPLLRYDTVKETTSGNGKRRITAGLNYSPKKHLIFKSEYQWTNEIKDPQVKDNGVMFSAILDF